MPSRSPAAPPSASAGPVCSACRSRNCSRPRRSRRRSKASAKAVIFLHQWGGPGQHETFDMKPDAPDNVRGWFKPTTTKLPGVTVGETLPKLAAMADKFTVIRCLQHTMKNHNSAGYYSLTGVAPPTDDQRLRDSLDLFPAYGSIVDKLAPAPKGVPTFVAYPHVIADGSITPGQHASFLGKAHNPLFVTQDPNEPDFRCRNSPCPTTSRVERLENRRDMLKLIDEQSRPARRLARRAGARRDATRRPWRCSRRREFKQAFDLSKEADEDPRRATAARPTARAACSPGGWSRPGRSSSTSTSRASIGGERAGLGHARLQRRQPMTRSSTNCCR